MNARRRMRPDGEYFLRILPALAPYAVQWVREQEAAILSEGACLNSSALEDARLLGVPYPERIRVLEMEDLPVPGNAVLRQSMEALGVVSRATRGVTFGNGIAVRAGFAETRDLIVHECVHVAQYQRMGGVKPFLLAYLRECIEVGYPNGPLEQEAIVKAQNLLSLEVAEL